jgi:hypothetical protein
MKQIQPMQMQPNSQTQTSKEKKVNKNQQQDLNRIASDKSFLPKASDLPVAKCGCT